MPVTPRKLPFFCTEVMASGQLGKTILRAPAPRVRRGVDHWPGPAAGVVFDQLYQRAGPEALVASAAVDRGLDCQRATAGIEKDVGHRTLGADCELGRVVVATQHISDVEAQYLGWTSARGGLQARDALPAVGLGVTPRDA